MLCNTIFLQQPFNVLISVIISLKEIFIAVVVESANRAFPPAAATSQLKHSSGETWGGFYVEQSQKTKCVRPHDQRSIIKNVSTTQYNCLFQITTGINLFSVFFNFFYWFLVPIWHPLSLSFVSIQPIIILNHIRIKQ